MAESPSGRAWSVDHQFGVHPGHEMAGHVAKQLVPTGRQMEPYALDAVGLDCFGGTDLVEGFLVDRQAVAAERWL